MTASANDVQRSRAAQVGFLMRAYREAFVWRDGHRGLTQEELLQRMADVSSKYGERYSHATVSRWESGATRPSVERLEVFGRALGLTAGETDGLIALAALSSEQNGGMRQPANGQYRGPPDNEKKQKSYPAARWRVFFGVEGEQGLHAGVVRFVLIKLFGLGALIVGSGFALSTLGWNPDWMPAAYVFLITVLVLAQGFLLPSQNGGLSEFFAVSLFVVLTTPVLQFERLDMDQYGFYRIGQFAGTHMPYMLVLLVNLALSTIAGVASKLLWRWHNSGDPAESSAIRRAAWVNVPPVAFVYVVVVVVSNTSVAIQLAVELAALAAMFTVMTALRDPFIDPSERDRQFLLSTAVTVGILFSLLGFVTILGIFIAPDVPAVLPDHNLLRTWNINFAELSFTRAEALERINLGYLWHATCVSAYMIFIVGGNMLVAIYRMRVTSQSDDAAIR